MQQTVVDEVIDEWRRYFSATYVYAKRCHFQQCCNDGCNMSSFSILTPNGWTFHDLL